MVHIRNSIVLSSNRNLKYINSEHSIRFNICKTVSRPRNMSAIGQPAPQPNKFEWIAILPDNEDALERRMSVRPDHFKGLTKRVEEGFWKLGGAMLDQLPTESDPALKFKGSVMIALASSREEVVEELKKDVYTANNVWDWDKVQIYPFKTAFRVP